MMDIIYEFELHLYVMINENKYIDEHIDDEQQDNGRIDNSSRHILHSAYWNWSIGVSSDNDNESRGTKYILINIISKIFSFLF